MVLETILDIEFQDMVAGDKAIFYQAIVVITFPHPFSLCIINIILHPLTAFIHSLWSLQYYYLWNNSINIDIEINQHQSISRTTGTLLTLCSSMDTSSPSPYLRWDDSVNLDDKTITAEHLNDCRFWCSALSICLPRTSSSPPLSPMPSAKDSQ